MSVLRVVSGACPACGGRLTTRPGVGLFTCGACPTAVEVSLGHTRRIDTVRPDEDSPADVLLPFLFFRFATPEGRRLVWVPAFLVLSDNHGPGDFQGRLSRQDPLLRPAPVGVPCGRDLAGALVLAREHLGASAPEPLETHDLRLVGLPATRTGRQVKEPLSSWRCRIDELWPCPSGETTRPPLQQSPAIAARDAARLEADLRAAANRFAWFHDFWSS